MAVFVREDADATVLRLDGVLANPIVAVADLYTAALVEVRPGRARPALPCVPTMTPDGPVVTSRRARLVADARMDRLEGIDVAIRFIEVAVAIIVIAIPDVELAQIRIDLVSCLAGCNLRSVPAVDSLIQEVPNLVSAAGMIEVIIIGAAGPDTCTQSVASPAIV